MHLTIQNSLIIIIGGLLFIAGITDIRKQMVSRRLLWILFMVCLVTVPFMTENSILSIIGGLAVGFCAIGISIASKEQVGKGDGIVITAIGLALGARRCLLVVCIASLLMSLIAIVILLFRRGNRHTRLPFLPAIFAGYVFCAGQVLIC
jgi:leader peptidase (prepilin peptidase)/N-methyltransferase